MTDDLKETGYLCHDCGHNIDGTEPGEPRLCEECMKRREEQDANQMRLF